MEVKITPDNFTQILTTSSVVLVDFNAAWCGPCRMLAPIVEDIAKEYEGSLTVATCDVDDCPDISMDYGVRNIPTLIFFKDGKPVDKTVGLVSAEQIKEKLNNLI